MRTWVTFLIAGFICAVGAAPVLADAAPSQRYQPPETPDDAFAVSRAQAFGHNRFGFQAHLDYANDPVVVELIQGVQDSELEPVVEHQVTLTPNIAYGLWDRFVFYFGVPLYVAQKSGSKLSELGLMDPERSTVGDLYLGARGQIFGSKTSPASLALQSTLTAPTAKMFNPDMQFSGEDSISFTPELLFEVQVDRFMVNLNGGVRVRPQSQDIMGLELGTDAQAALGLAYRVAREPNYVANLHFQGFGSADIGDFLGRNTTHLELLFGGKVHMDNGIAFGGAAGPGITRGFGTPDLRIIITAGWSTYDEDSDPLAPGECKFGPEDYDGFQDEDDCADPDNDLDGILDYDDRCPDDPEDKDGYEDTNGCSDPDNDGDRIPDDQDKCPMESEDRDGFEDQDGCPDLDNDDDKIPDLNDACPQVYGSPDNGGCPTG